MSRPASLKVLIWLRFGAVPPSVTKKFVCCERNFFLQVSKNLQVSNKFLEPFITRPETNISFLQILLLLTLWFQKLRRLSCDFSRQIASLHRSNVLTNRINCQKFLSKSLTAFFDAWKVKCFLSNGDLFID